MHRHLIDWYRSVHPEPPADLLKRVWKMIETQGKRAAEERAIPDLVRMFNGRKPQSTSFAVKFHEAVRKLDPNVPATERQLELRVLSGIILIHLIEQGPPALRDLASLGVVCGHCEGIGPELALTDVLVVANQRLSQRRRERWDHNAPSAIVDPAGVSAAISGQVSGAFGIYSSNPEILTGKPAEIGRQIVAPINQLSTQLRTLGVSSRRSVEHLLGEVERLREETNILWWLFAATSRDLGEPLSALTLPAATILVGKELADLVEQVPGPPAAEAFILKMLQGAQPAATTNLTIENALASSRGATLEQIRSVVTVESADLLPVHAAAVAYGEAEGAAGWVQITRTRVGVDPMAALGSTRLAVQVYNERLLARLLDAFK